MGICGNCKYWDDSQWIMNKYGEGLGLGNTIPRIVIIAATMPSRLKKTKI